jgi:xylulokinase
MKRKPEVNPDAKGVFYGVGLDTKKSHFVRSILEAVAYMLRENIEVLENMGISCKRNTLPGWGSKSRLCSQIKADVNNCSVGSMSPVGCCKRFI